MGVEPPAMAKPAESVGQAICYHYQSYIRYCRAHESQF